MLELAPGLWRWTAPHPDWKPPSRPGSASDWDQWVGSVLYVSPEAAVFVDPMLPPERELFWAWADEHAQGRAVHVLTTIRWHRRSRDEVVARYGAQTSRARGRLPAGVEPLVLRGAGETAFWLPEHGAVVFGDRVLGDGNGGLRLCPESWLVGLRRPIGHSELRVLLAPLRELAVERVLVSHGTPVLRGAREALEELLSG